MRWLQTEYILKGIYLGLLVYAALEGAAAPEPDWWAPVRVTLCSLVGLAVCLGIAGWLKMREGYKTRGQLPAFVLFLLLESPALVYSGVLLGTAPLVNGVATITVKFKQGAHPLSATYAGNAKFNGSSGTRSHPANEFQSATIQMAVAGDPSSRFHSVLPESWRHFGHGLAALTGGTARVAIPQRDSDRRGSPNASAGGLPREWPPWRGDNSKECR